MPRASGWLLRGGSTSIPCKDPNGEPMSRLLSAAEENSMKGATSIGDILNMNMRALFSQCKVCIQTRYIVSLPSTGSDTRLLESNAYWKGAKSLLLRAQAGNCMMLKSLSRFCTQDISLQKLLPMKHPSSHYMQNCGVICG